MGVTNVNIRVDKDVKEAAERIFGELGLTMSSAVNIFLRQAIRENGIPFELKLGSQIPDSGAVVQPMKFDPRSKEDQAIAEIRSMLEI